MLLATVRHSTPALLRSHDYAAIRFSTSPQFSTIDGLPLLGGNSDQVTPRRPGPLLDGRSDRNTPTPIATAQPSTTDRRRVTTRHFSTATHGHNRTRRVTARRHIAPQHSLGNSPHNSTARHIAPAQRMPEPLTSHLDAAALLADPRHSVHAALLDANSPPLAPHPHSSIHRSTRLDVSSRLHQLRAPLDDDSLLDASRLDDTTPLLISERGKTWLVVVSLLIRQ